MTRERIRQRVDLVIAGWPWHVSDASKATSGYIIEYEDGRWEFHLTGYGTVRGDRREGGRELAALILRAFAPNI